MKISLLEKYDKPTPRYTSYPTVPYWETAPSQQIWMRQIRHRVDQNGEISLYIHLPFCEQLCTYCGCNKRITVNHDVEKPYIESLLKEWNLYCEVFPQMPILKELHLGGGTPTFFSPQNLDYLLENLLKSLKVPADRAFSFEAHPNNTSLGHLETFRHHGFNRISIGIQDFSPVIMSAINRRQDEEQIFRLTSAARELGFESVNFDLIYGLPFQRLQHIRYNLAKLAELMPDRIAYYGYAHVPWKQACQRRFTDVDIPKGVDKRALYEAAYEGLEHLGYQSIGMDHFALPSDELYRSANAKSLHRNFMGYTPYETKVLIGLGASAISEGGNSFVQNTPKVEAYQGAIERGILPIHRGHQLNQQDQLLQRHIRNLMCQFSTSWAESEWQAFPDLQKTYERLQPMKRDGLVELTEHGVTVTPIGSPFVRNIAQCFDTRYWQKQPAQAVFSSSL